MEQAPGQHDGRGAALRRPAGPASVWQNAVVARPSIFEVAGGEPAFLALAAAHHERCLRDPVLSHPFEHGVRPDHVQRLAHYWAEVFGGPDRYTRDFGDRSSMLELHARQGGDAEFSERFVACFVAAVDDARLPEDAELRTAMRAYMEWAVDEVMSYAPRDAEVPAGLRVPRWSWDGLLT